MKFLLVFKDDINVQLYTEKTEGGPKTALIVEVDNNLRHADILDIQIVDKFGRKSNKDKDRTLVIGIPRRSFRLEKRGEK